MEPSCMSRNGAVNGNGRDTFSRKGLSDRCPVSAPQCRAIGIDFRGGTSERLENRTKCAVWVIICRTSEELKKYLTSLAKKMN